MKSAQSFQEFESEWKNCLNAVEKIWVKAERACQHVRNEFQPWQGRFARERKKDPLLRYLKHARNVDQHSIQECMTRKQAERRLGPAYGNTWHINHLEIRNGEVVSYRGDKPLLVTDLPNRIELLPVKDRTKWFNPPSMHKGQKLFWAAPVTIAELGLEYYRSFLVQVEEAFFDGSAA